MHFERGNVAVGEAGAELVAHVGLEAADDQPFVAVVVALIVGRVGDGGRVEHVDQAGETFRLAVVRGGGEHHQGIGAGGQQFGQPGTLGAAAALGDVVGFVDDDDVPIGLFQIVAVFDVLLEGVDGNNGAVKMVERVMVGRDTVAHPLQALRVQTGQTNAETVPELLLELGEHGFDRQHQNALALATGDQLANQNAGFEGFTQTHGIGNQNALARLAQRLAGRLELVGQQVKGGVLAGVDAVVGGDGIAHQGVQIQAAGAVLAGGVVYQLGVLRFQHTDARFQLA